MFQLMTTASVLIALIGPTFAGSCDHDRQMDLDNDRYGLYDRIEERYQRCRAVERVQEAQKAQEADEKKRQANENRERVIAERLKQEQEAGYKRLTSMISF